MQKSNKGKANNKKVSLTLSIAHRFVAVTMSFSRRPESFFRSLALASSGGLNTYAGDVFGRGRGGVYKGKEERKSQESKEEGDSNNATTSTFRVTPQNL